MQQNLEDSAHRFQVSQPWCCSMSDLLFILWNSLTENKTWHQKVQKMYTSLMLVEDLYEHITRGKQKNTAIFFQHLGFQNIQNRPVVFFSVFSHQSWWFRKPIWRKPTSLAPFESKPEGVKFKSESFGNLFELSKKNLGKTHHTWDGSKSSPWEVKVKLAIMDSWGPGFFGRGYRCSMVRFLHGIKQICNTNLFGTPQQLDIPCEKNIWRRSWGSFPHEWMIYPLLQGFDTTKAYPTQC